MGILSGNPKKEPLHYGEVFDIWGYSMGAGLALSCYQTYMNHIGDKDLKELVRDLMEQSKKEIAECNQLLKINEIAPPPALPDKPEAKLEDIPVGARFTDPEISSLVMAKLAAGVVLCSQVMAKCIREDVAALFEKYHTVKAALSLRSLQISKQKGWLVPPPLQMERLEPVNA